MSNQIPEDQKMTLPLSDVKVLDLTHVCALLGVNVRV